MATLTPDPDKINSAGTWYLLGYLRSSVLDGRGINQKRWNAAVLAAEAHTANMRQAELDAREGCCGEWNSHAGMICNKPVQDGLCPEHGEVGP